MCSGLIKSDNANFSVDVQCEHSLKVLLQSLHLVVWCLPPSKTVMQRNYAIRAKLMSQILISLVAIVMTTVSHPQISKYCDQIVMSIFSLRTQVGFN